RARRAERPLRPRLRPLRGDDGRLLPGARSSAPIGHPRLLLRGPAHPPRPGADRPTARRVRGRRSPAARAGARRIALHLLHSAEPAGLLVAPAGGWHRGPDRALRAAEPPPRLALGGAPE